MVLLLSPARRTDPELVRFGLLWRLYDMAQSMRFSYTIPVLGELSSSQVPD